ncbi:hypothetical protein HMI54_006748 [Coelomomyces lativittatus]|nr:hypothetical protein HMI56_004026 [Coelomomyces lativittatus]KAJ1504651.1 hypothetical protein HMI54_006748 [Coelomomyces lativittatus]KAJ1512622.1 hypothetical protein HMI55_006162 [Coelomomyces lativittatus]
MVVTSSATVAAAAASSVLNLESSSHSSFSTTTTTTSTTKNKERHTKLPSTFHFTNTRQQELHSKNQELAKSNTVLSIQLREHKLQLENLRTENLHLHQTQFKLAAELEHLNYLFNHTQKKSFTSSSTSPLLNQNELPLLSLSNVQGLAKTTLEIFHSLVMHFTSMATNLETNVVSVWSEVAGLSCGPSPCTSSPTHAAQTPPTPSPHPKKATKKRKIHVHGSSPYSESTEDRHEKKIDTVLGSENPPFILNLEKNRVPHIHPPRKFVPKPLPKNPMKTHFQSKLKRQRLRSPTNEEDLTQTYQASDFEVEVARHGTEVSSASSPPLSCAVVSPLFSPTSPPLPKSPIPPRFLQGSPHSTPTRPPPGLETSTSAFPSTSPFGSSSSSSHHPPPTQDQSWFPSSIPTVSPSPPRDRNSGTGMSKGRGGVAWVTEPMLMENDHGPCWEPPPPLQQRRLRRRRRRGGSSPSS